MIEHPVLIPVAEGLAGIVTRASKDSASGIAAVFLDTGLTYRVGANRLSVRIARRLAEAGIGALRFDFSGVGDSPPRTDGVPFSEAAPEEVRGVMDWMASHSMARRFVLIGLCSGARVGFQGAVSDPRVVGVVMLNLRNLESEEYSDLRAVAVSYAALGELRRPHRWKRALTGRTDYRTVLANLGAALRRIIRRGPAVAQASHVGADLLAILKRGTQVRLVSSEEEFGRKYLPLALGADHDRVMAHPGISEQIVPDADHTFTWPSAQDAVLQGVVAWTTGLGASVRDGPDLGGGVSP